MARQRNNNSAGLVIFYVLLLFVLVALIGFIAYFTNNFTDDFKTFYVKSGKRVFATIDDYAITSNDTAEFSVGYTFGFINDDNTSKNFTVRVLPNVTEKTKFTYLVDGERNIYDSEMDLSSAFNIQLKENGFSLTMPSNLQKVLSAVYDGQTVEIPDEIDMCADSYYKLVVTSYNGKSEIIINLFYGNKVTDMYFDVSEIVF